MDVLVEFQPGTTPGFFAMEEVRAELSTLLGGREVDLVTPAALHPLLRERILSDAVAVRGMSARDEGIDQRSQHHRPVDSLLRAAFSNTLCSAMTPTMQFSKVTHTSLHPAACMAVLVQEFVPSR